MYVLNHTELSTFGPLKFFVIRDAKTLYGHLTVPAESQQTAQQLAPQSATK